MLQLQEKQAEATFAETKESDEGNCEEVELGRLEDMDKNKSEEERTIRKEEDQRIREVCDMVAFTELQRIDASSLIFQLMYALLCYRSIEHFMQR